MSDKNSQNLQEEIIGFLKSRGFVFASSEIYGGLSGVYDYGHYGYLLVKNIKDAWMKSMIQERDDVVSLDSAIFMHPMTWKASGHVDGFNDPQIDCKNCKFRMRADHLLERFGVVADKQSIEFVNSEIEKIKESDQNKIAELKSEDNKDALKNFKKRIICDSCGSDDLTEARVFSLMVKSNLGSPVDKMTDENVMYLRPETCGGIYLEYKNTLDSLHPKLPFGIAQIGKAFRNEITAKQFIFRTREFEQMEMQYFFNPLQSIPLYEGGVTQKYFDEWKKYRWDFYLNYGIKETSLKWYKHEKLAHYASDAYDIEYKYKMLGDSFKELEGVHQRGDWDLTQHAKFSGADLSYFDEINGRLVPHIMETSVGVARMMLAFIDDAYVTEDLSKEIINENGDKVKKEDSRIVLKLDKRLSPIKIAVLPLSKKENLQSKAREIWKTLNKKYMCEYDESGSVGKRYRRQDEIGTPYCVTVDFETVEKNEAENKDKNERENTEDNFDTVTVRDRDSMTQDRVKVSDLEKYFSEKFA